ncbi:hypothetical protein MSAN_02415600 [Mycena sanguinolenta]|uniref:Uncharacterized protein n=1 Tax=Mycena sanguinolenta TaxID=230812 RepID=A0A8H7CEK1_9AGAR|nr:hypothetical protein MSAN_02415600 [Mycena sanguinolenta]
MSAPVVNIATYDALPMHGQFTDIYSLAVVFWLVLFFTVLQWSLYFFQSLHGPFTYIIVFCNTFWFSLSHGSSCHLMLWSSESVPLGGQDNIRRCLAALFAGFVQQEFLVQQRISDRYNKSRCTEQGRVEDTRSRKGGNMAALMGQVDNTQ